MDVVQLSRIQFAITIMFHYLFPPLTIGMGVVLVYLQGMYLYSKEPIYQSAAKFWTQLFAVTFAVGVATGIVMFGLIYVLLGAVWVFVLNHKIQLGPEPPPRAAAPAGGAAFLQMERRRVEHEGSMTEAKQPERD